jgi:hypothetical protein
MRNKLLVFILAAIVITTATTVAMAQETGTTNEQMASPETTIVITAPDVASAEAAIAAEVGAYAAEVERQKAEQESAAAAAAAAAQTKASVTPNYDPGDGSRWDRLAQCECGGNWGCNTGNGFGGGLQFMHQRSYSTWLSYGGGEFAPHPWEASREQQIVIAEKVLAGSGWKAWPGCSRKFGWL